MTLVDWAARWNPVPDEPPRRVWLPAPPTPAQAAHRAAPSTTRAPQSITIALTPQQADDLPLWLPRLLARQDLVSGDRVTVDLAGLRSVHLTGLELLLTVLWRRVAPHGEVLLTGGTPGLRAQLDSLGLTPARCRAAAYGRPSARASTPAPVPAPAPAPAPTGSPCPAPRVPRQAPPQDPLQEAASGGTLESR